MSYVIITPAKNEASCIRQTLQSVVNQTFKPRQWIIVNDASTDETLKIIKDFANQYDWITPVTLTDQNTIRAGGIKVVNLFNIGYRHINEPEFDFISKLDADIILPDNYYKKIAECFTEYPDVGLCGGYLFYQKAGKRVEDRTADYHLRGAIKSYRKACFDAIGGLQCVFNWDGLDEMEAMYQGWKVRILSLPVEHLRATSTSINRGLKNSLLAGKEYYKDGNDILISLMRSFSYGMRTKPRLATSILFLFGYFHAFIRRQKKHVNHDLEKFIRDYQHHRMRHALMNRLKLKRHVL